MCVMCRAVYGCSTIGQAGESGAGGSGDVPQKERRPLAPPTGTASSRAGQWPSSLMVGHAEVKSGAQAPRSPRTVRLKPA